MADLTNPSNSARAAARRGHPHCLPPLFIIVINRRRARQPCSGAKEPKGPRRLVATQDRFHALASGGSLTGATS